MSTPSRGQCGKMTMPAMVIFGGLLWAGHCVAPWTPHDTHHVIASCQSLCPPLLQGPQSWGHPGHSQELLGARVTLPAGLRAT